jgi:ribose-phosphate pyrophosphokinase
MITFKAKTSKGEIINSALSAFRFPAGEAHLKREDRRDLEPTEIAILTPSPESLHDDLFAVAMWSDYLLQQSETKQRVLLIPYVPGARADRGTPFGAFVYADFITYLNLSQIVVFDPHSATIVDLLNDRSDSEITVVSSAELLATPAARQYLLLGQYAGIIAPDKGARDRAKAVADLAGLPVFTASKTRDFETGKLKGFEIEDLPESGRLLIVDDICDGGGTFMGIAAASGLPKDRLDLFVSHGVFSGNAAQLETAFNTVYTTNSFDSKNNSLSAVRIPVQPLLLSKVK